MIPEETQLTCEVCGSLIEGTEIRTARGARYSEIPSLVRRTESLMLAGMMSALVRNDNEKRW